MIPLDLPLIIVLALVAALTAASMAVRSVSRIWLRHWAGGRLRGSDAATVYLERPQRLLVAAGMGTAASLLLAGMLLAAGATGVSLTVKVVVFALLVIALGQIVPRAIARRWPSIVAPVVLPVLQAVELVTRPLGAIGNLIARPFLPSPDGRIVVDDRDLIYDLLREGELEGVGERDEIAIISGVVEFSGKRVDQVMRPVGDVFALPASLTAAQLADQIASAGYSRTPLYEGSIDNVVGMVHAFDVLRSGGEDMPPLRPVAIASPSAPCTELLFRMLRERRHLAIVRDFDRTVGLVTLEDLLEELVGDIRDEHDDPAPAEGA